MCKAGRELNYFGFKAKRDNMGFGTLHFLCGVKIQFKYDKETAG